MPLGLLEVGMNEGLAETLQHTVGAGECVLAPLDDLRDVAVASLVALAFATAFGVVPQVVRNLTSEGFDTFDRQADFVRLVPLAIDDDLGVFIKRHQHLVKCRLFCWVDIFR